MDILGKYEQERPQAVIKQPLYGASAVPSEGFLINAVMKLSGGAIRDRRQALMALTVFAGLIFLIAVIVFFRSIGVTQHPVINAPLPGITGNGMLPQ